MHSKHLQALIKVKSHQSQDQKITLKHTKFLGIKSELQSE